MNNAEFESFRKIYINAREQLLDKITKAGGAGTKTYYNTALQSLNQIVEELNNETARFISTEIPKEYEKSLNDTYSYFQKNHLLMNKPNMFAQIHRDAVYSLVREMQYNIQGGLAQAGRQILRYLDESRDEALRMAGLEASAEKIASGSTIVDMKKNMVKKLKEQGFMTVQYGSGKNAYQVSLDSYAMLCARSTTREAGNIARENQLAENGYDLMEMTEHYPTCELCATLQGRVYSISGNDKRFPPLSKAFPSGYQNVHPNCQHSMTPWIEEFNDVDEAVRKSSRAFADPRNKDEIDLYNKQQSENRKMRESRYQYERYREVLGDDVPKSFHTFRQLKKADGDMWRDLTYYYKYKGDRPTYCVKIDRELMKNGINEKGIAYPADNYIVINGMSTHAKKRLTESGLSENIVAKWVKAAKIMLKKYPEPNSVLNFYCNDGIIGIKEDSHEVRTVIAKERYGNETMKILEVIKKHVK